MADDKDETDSEEDRLERFRSPMRLIIDDEVVYDPDAKKSQNKTADAATKLKTFVEKRRSAPHR